MGLGFAPLLPPPLRGIALNAPPIAAAAAVGELLQREAARHQLAFELGLAGGAGRAIFKLVRRLRVPGTVNEKARAPFRRGRANQPHRFGPTHKQPDCFDKTCDQGAGQST